MLGALTYHAIAAMTRERLESIDRILLAKIRSQRNVSPLERQVRFLAKTAHESMSLAPHLPNERTLPPFARNLSLHTVFGSAGPTFPRFAAMFAPGQQWLFETLHGGTPDPDRQRVLARSTDFLITLSERGTALINTSDVADKPAELRKLRAYLLGHTCHIAADLVSAPFVDSATWQLGDGSRSRLGNEQVVSAIEQAAAQLFRRDLVTTPSLSARGDLYQDWWLKPDDLPVSFFEAFTSALDTIYGPGARPVARPASGSSALAPQVTAAFAAQFGKDDPPGLSVRLLEDGYSAFRSVMEGSYVWNFGDWLAATAWMFLPPIGAYPLVVAMPHTRALFKDDATVDGQAVDTELGWFGLVMAPLATSLLAPIILNVYIAAFTYQGIGQETGFGLGAAAVHFITAIIFLATIGQAGHPVLRWLFLFIVPFVGLLVHAIYVLARGGSDPRHLQLALGSLVPCGITLLYVLFHVAWHQSQDLGMNGWLKEPDGKGWGNGGFIGGWILWAVLMVGSWLVTSRLLMHSKGSEPEADAFVTGEKHYLRLFGYSSLMFDPDLAADPAAERARPSLATHYFPTDRRPLLKLWWEGTGDLFMRSDRHSLQFSTSEDGTGNPQAVLGPAAAMTATEFAALLTRAVKDGTSFNENLKAEIFSADDFDYILPGGEVFADAGDDGTTIAAHDAAAGRFFRLKTSPGDATVLYHAPRSHLASVEGADGPVVVVDTPRAAAVTGPGQATFVPAAVLTGDDATRFITVIGDAATRFTTFFRSGDVIATTGVSPNESRTILSVPNDHTLIVTVPFTTAVAGSHAYQRAANTRETDTPAGTLRPGATVRTYQGTGFDAMFLPGDVIRVVPEPPASPEDRTVVKVMSATEIEVDRPFSAALSGTLGAAGVPCMRVGRLNRQGFRYAPVAGPAGLFAGDSLMERAADLGALLCMGAASHTLGATERQAVTAGADEERRPAVNTVYQVFRNWNLNHRRVNEWQMLVGGGAASEKRGTPAVADPLQPAVPSAFTALTPAGEETANRLGWVPLLEHWLAAASRPGVDSLADTSFREGDPSNRRLSEGIAFLLDLPMPA
jgi:hypothetical protein